jgi:SAM-dependent methyltransferase
MSTSGILRVYQKGGTRAHISAIRDLIDNYTKSKRGVVWILEAGAADRDYFRFASPVVVTGIDISAQELADEKYNVRIIGDVQTYKTGKTYDVVICWYVLEHLSDPVGAFLNVLDYTREGGLSIIAVPNVWSLKGLLTKVIPFWLHKAVRSVVLSGNRDYEPFKTYLRFSISPRNMVRRCAKHEIIYQGYSGVVIGKYFNGIYEFIINVLKFISLGRCKPELSEFILVIRKRG